MKRNNLMPRKSATTMMRTDNRGLHHIKRDHTSSAAMKIGVAFSVVALVFGVAACNDSSDQTSLSSLHQNNLEEPLGEPQTSESSTDPSQSETSETSKTPSKDPSTKDGSSSSSSSASDKPIPKSIPKTKNRSGLPWGSGVFAHNKERVARFEKVIGRPLDVMSVAPQRGSWSSIMDPWWLDTAPEGFTGTIDVAVPLWQEDGSLAVASQGGYNTQWEALGKLIASKYPDGYVRPGWEFNLKGWPWAANEGNAESWKKAFRHASQSLKRAAPGLRIEWNPNAGTGDGLADATKVYPGDDVVDIIAIDSYDWWPGYTNAEAINNHLTKTGGWNYWIQFARDHKKQFSVPEWGVAPANSNGGGDNPLFIETVVNVLHKNADIVAHADYFDETDSYIANSIADGQAPKAGAKYKEMLDKVAANPTTTGTDSGATGAPQSSEGGSNTSKPADSNAGDWQRDPNSERGPVPGG